MDNEALLQRIKELEEQLSKATKENEIVIQKLYEANIKLNKALETIAIYQEKYGIERIKQFIPKNEKLDKIVINEAEEIIKETKSTNKGKKYKKRAFNYEKYVKEVRDIYPDESTCSTCGSELVEASKKIRYVVEVVPATISVIKLVKHSLKCPNCNKQDNKIYSPIVNETFNGSILSPSFAAYIAYAKYDLGVPFHHLANHISEHLGFEISKQDLANYMAKCAKTLEPIYNRLKLDLLNSPAKVIHSDETTLTVSKPADESRKKSYVYVYTSSFYDANQIRIYDFHESRSIEATSNWLKNYDGFLITDNFSGYNKLKKDNPNIRIQKCWAHVRRRFADIMKHLKKGDKTASSAFEILNEISKLFKLEEEYKKKKLLKSQIEQRRKIDVPPIKRKLENILDKLKPNKISALYGAVNYMRDCYPELFTYLDNGLCEPTNNTCERAIKPFVVQRKIFQTSGSYAGARYTTILFSLIQTCKINNVDPQKYFEYVLNNLDNPISELLPYSKNIKNL